MTKYHNRKTTKNGYAFDSKKEADRYIELSMLEKAGKIQNLQRQVKFVLIPTQYESYERYGKTGKRLKDGKKCVEKACTYVADFVYEDANGNRIVEDCKGYRTKEYKIKRKLMLKEHGIKLKET